MSATACTHPTSQSTAKAGSRWPLERVLFALAGTMTLLSAASRLWSRPGSWC